MLIAEGLMDGQRPCLRVFPKKNHKKQEKFCAFVCSFPLTSFHVADQVRSEKGRLFLIFTHSTVFCGCLFSPKNNFILLKMSGVATSREYMPRHNKEQNYRTLMVRTYYWSYLPRTVVDSREIVGNIDHRSKTVSFLYVLMTSVIIAVFSS